MKKCSSIDSTLQAGVPVAMDELALLARDFGLPPQALSVLEEKKITLQSLVKSFEDDEQFADFMATELQRRLGSCSRRMRLALKRLRRIQISTRRHTRSSIWMLS